MCLRQLLILGSLLLLSGLVQADVDLLKNDLITCQQQQDDQARLACFDDLATNVAQTPKAKTLTTVKGVAMKVATDKQSYLERKWHLSDNTKSDAFISLEPHRQNYIVASMSSNPNDNAQTPSLPATGPRGLQNKDVQFQISFKTPLFADIPLIRSLPWVESSRLWAAYTQRSYWQVFDGSKSEPFRETNFAPELILSLGLGNDHPMWIPRMLNLGAIHESNGREEPYSRSWNRIYLEAGWQLGDQYTVVLRPWWAPESDVGDNPDIDRFLGYGDLRLRWDSQQRNKWAELLLRNNLRSDNKGYAKFNFNYAISDHLSWYLMLSSGYGESLLDYNHNQNTIGLGFSVGE